MSEIKPQKLSELEKKIRYQVACEERAHRIVEKLVDQTVTEEYLVDAGHYITPSHYEDIVEERAIAKQCGYPICNNQIKKVLQQKYHICTKTNKVFDITDRKNFCSNPCYKASKHFGSQISSSPLWTRKDEPQRPLVLLPLSTTRGSCGEEVIDSTTAIKYEVEKIEKNDRQKEKVSAGKKGSPVSKVETATKMKDSHEKEKDSEGVEDLPIENLTISDSSVSSRSDRKVDSGVNYSEESGKSETRSSCETVGSHRSDENVGKGETSVNVFNNPDDRNSMEETQTGDSGGSKIIASCPLENSNNPDIKVTRETVRETLQSGSTSSKMDMLMKLLDKRKHMLGKMAQIETVVPSSQPKKDEKVLDSDDEASNKMKREDQTLASTGSHSNNQILVDIETVGKQSSLEVSDEGLNQKRSEGKDDRGQERAKTLISEIDSENVLRQKGEKQTEKKKTSKQTRKQAKNISTVQLICHSMQDWITMETRKYLNIGDVNQKTEDEDPDKEGAQERVNFTPEMEKRYQELCHRVDLQEVDIDDVIGESNVEAPHSDRKPVPDFEKLQQETEQFSLKVQGFFQGDTRLKKVMEKEPEGQVYLHVPSVDSHDQMLIRKKILMDRLNKSMPELLPPLKLSIQDVFTQLREMVSTFSLSSHNILFKPAEWTLVSLILLKLLGRKDLHIACAFLNPSTVGFFSVLLQALGESLESVELYISQMIKVS